MSRKLEGTVQARRTKKRYEGATVRLEPKEKTGDLKDVEPDFCDTDDDGDFQLDVSDEKKWPPGEYTLTAFHPDASLGPVEKTIKLEAGKQPAFQWIELPDPEISNRRGVFFFFVLVLALGSLIYGYIYLHWTYHDEPTSINEELTSVVELALTQAALTQADEASALDSSSLVLQTVADAESLFVPLRQDTTLFSAARAQRVEGMFGQAQTAIVSGKAPELKTVLENLHEATFRPASPFFWETDPLRLLEIILWALGATLLRLVLRTGNYIKRRTFYKHAILNHLSLVVTVPLLALLIAFVLSLVDVSLSLSDVELKLDMSNVYISIVVASLIGIAPWEAWDFVEALADRLFGALTRLVSTSG